MFFHSTPHQGVFVHVRILFIFDVILTIWVDKTNKIFVSAFYARGFAACLEISRTKK